MSQCFNLQKANIVNQERRRWLSLDITTGDIRANCDDLKVLGKGDFKALLKWRLAIREEVNLIDYYISFNLTFLFFSLVLMLKRRTLRI